MERSVVKPRTIHLVVFGLVAALLLLSSCAPAPAASPAAPTTGPEEPAADAAAASVDSDAIKAVNDMKPSDMATAVSARTPVPTATPGLLDRQISAFSAEKGLSGQVLLGIPVEGWIDLAVTALLLLLSYVLLTVLLRRLIGWLAKRTSTEEHRHHWRTIGVDGQWLIFLVLVRFGILHLDLFGDGFRRLVDDVTFVISLLWTSSST